MNQITRFDLSVVPYINIDADDKELIEALETIRGISAKLYMMVLKQHVNSLHEEMTSYTDRTTGETVMCKMTDIPLSLFGNPNQSLLRRLDKGIKLYPDLTYNCVNKTILELYKEQEEKKKENV